MVYTLIFLFIFVSYVIINTYRNYRYKKLLDKYRDIFIKYESIINNKYVEDNKSLSEYYLYIGYKNNIWAFRINISTEVTNELEMYKNLIEYIEKHFDHLDYFKTIKRDKIIDDLLK